MVLRQALPLLERAAGRPVIGTVSVRADLMDAIEEAIFGEPIDELMLSVAPHGLSTCCTRTWHTGYGTSVCR